MTDIVSPRDLPQVEAFAAQFDGDAPASVVRSEVRIVVDGARRLLLEGRTTTLEGLQRELSERLAARQPMTEVINATGVLLHTNLGRAQLDPLPSYTDGLGAVPIELALGDGRRHRRLAGLEADLCHLTGAEDALVVNNNAAALLLVLSSLAGGGEVVISRGQLIEIGGSFRIPEIIRQGGALLREVGTTNRTHLRDFESAINDSTRVLLEVHPSNFEQIGFVSTVPTADLAALARERDLKMVFDIGSGLIDSTVPWVPGDTPSWLADEPGARQALEAGADIVTFSGDKLLGGPQAGIVCGDRELLEVIRRHPLTRALRYDKVRAAHLHATVRSYLARSASSIPFWRQASTNLDDLAARAEAIVCKLTTAGIEARHVSVDDSAGAGSTPGKPIEGRGVAVKGPVGADALANGLRRHNPPVIALTREGLVVLSLRAVRPHQDATLVAAVLGVVLADRSDRPPTIQP